MIANMELDYVILNKTRFLFGSMKILLNNSHLYCEKLWVKQKIAQLIHV